MHDDATRTTSAPREKWMNLADSLLRSVSPYRSPRGALITLPGPASASGRWSDGLEGFARTFLLAALRVAGAGGDDPAGLLPRYSEGLTAGVDPSGVERWPTIAERRQAVVEAASIAISLSETRPWLWDRLDQTTRAQVVDWLSGVVGTSGYTNNWIWFQNVIEAFLAEVGAPWSRQDLDRNEEIMEGLYVGDGWYSDGASPGGARQSFDYYAGWAWHVYPLLCARIRGVELETRHRERLSAFVAQAADLIAADGAPLLQGRSLTYRFAMLAPLWAGVIAGATPLPTGRTREIGDAVLNHFTSAGSVDERGLLPIGWHREFLGIRQLYTGSSSPYWASKGLMGLLLPPDHAEWSAVPAASPPNHTTVRAQPSPGWLVISSPQDGIVRVLNHGSDGFRGPVGTPRADNPFYQRLGYSTTTSPELSPSGIAEPLESHVALLDEQGRPSHRDLIERVTIGSRVAVSRSRVRWLDTPAAFGGSPPAAGWAAMRIGPRVTVASVVNGVSEVRLAWWDAAPLEPRAPAVDDADAVWPEDAGPWRFRVGGWALPIEADNWRRGADGATVTRDDGLTSSVVAVQGLEQCGLETRSGSNPLATRSVTPWVASSGVVSERQVVAAVVILAGASVAAHSPSVMGIDVDTHGVTVRWDDDTSDFVARDGEAVG